jgi:hypothetical protein
VTLFLRPMPNSAAFSRLLTRAAYSLSIGAATLQAQTLPSPPALPICDANPYVITTCFANGHPGTPTAPTAAGALDTLVAWRYQDSGTSTTNKLTLADAKDIGSTWGLAYDKCRNKMYVSAVVRRHSGLGYLGEGGIYSVDLANISAPSIAPLITVAGTNPAGLNLTGTGRGLATTSSATSADPIGFQAVAKVGLGDIDLSADCSVLYAVNLGGQDLVFINTATGTQISSLDIYDNSPAAVTGTCAKTEFRPWAVKSAGGQVLVGAVCSGESGGALRAYVLRLNAAGTGFTVDFSYPLPLTGRDTVWTRTNFSAALNTAALNGSQWKPWISAWPTTTLNNPFGSGESYIVHSQPILTDIEMDATGSLTLGYLDRMGMLGGRVNVNPSNAGKFTSLTGGDIIRVCRSGQTYSLEGTPGCPYPTPTENEFYTADAWNNGTYAEHQEVAIGGLTLSPNGTEVMSTVYDPLDGSGNFNAGGTRRFNNTTGALVPSGAFRIYASADVGTFGKAVGLGDLELACPEPKMSVGNLVFRDVDNDGKFEPGAGEAGIDGVRVQIFSAGADGALGGGDDVEINVGPDGIRNTADDATGGLLTSGGGCYYFSSLAPGKYFISIPASQFDVGSPAAKLKGLVSSTGNQTDNGLDDTTGENGIDATTLTGLATGGITSTVIDLADNAEVTTETGACNTLDNVDDNNGDLSVDFGFWQPLCLGNLVFNDSNADGLLTSENGLSGALVELFKADGSPAVNYLGQPVASITTGGSGQYLFCDLPPGDFKVRVTPPARNLPTTAAAQPDVDLNPADNDSNGVVVVGQPYVESLPVTLAPGTEPINDDDEFDYTNTTVDFGFVATVGVGNLVFKDNNGNAAFDAGDAAVGGVTVQLFKQGDNPLTATPVAVTTTGTSNPTLGCYLFDGLRPGPYFTFIPPVMFQAGGPLAGSFSTPGADVGLGDDDTAENGLDSATPATSGITSIPFALSNNGEPINETGACNTQDDADDNNIRLTIDFGFVDPVCLGNLVFSEVNNNGLQDDATPMSGALVEAFRLVDGVLQPANLASTGATVPAQTTTGTGLYEFCDLPPGDYVVRVTPPGGFVSSLSGGDPDNNTGNDSNGQPVDGQTYVQSLPVTLVANAEPTGDGTPGSGDDDNSNNTVDFGFVPGAIATPVALGDRVWCDTNGNGVQDAGENGVAGVIVTLTVGSNTITDTTDSSGLYHFASNTNAAFLSANIGQPAVISVDRTSPALSGCSLATVPNNSGNDQTDSDATPDSGNPNLIKITTVVPPTNTTDNSNDFGFTPPVCLGNLVFLDANRDGLSTGDAGLAGATVTLFQGNGTSSVTDINGATVAPIVTTANGYYQFCNLAPGNYVVQVRPPLPATGGAGPGYVATTAAATVDPDANPADDDSNNTPSGTVADPHQVVSPPVTLIVGGEPVGDDDNDANANNTVDFGFYPLVGVGNLVWKDKNGNSIYDAGDAPVENVVVQVWPEGATPSGSSPYQTTTDAGGRWLITSMPPGRYFALIPASQFQAGGPLAGCLSSPNVEVEPGGTAPDDNVGENGIDDITPATNGIRTRNFNLRVDLEPFAAFGETGEDLNADVGPALDDDSIDLTKDFAFFAPAAITGRIFADIDNDNDGDVPLNAVTLLLCRDLNGDGDADDAGEGPADDPNTPESDVYTLTTITNTYAFTGLAPGGYVVKQTQPAGYVNVTNLDSAPDLVASPGDGAISTPLDQIPAVVTSGETDTGNDFIEEQTVAIGNLVFTDNDNDGKFEPANGEEGIDAVTVQLWTPGPDTAIGGGDDVLVSSMTTGNGGCYLFSGLAPGSYYAQIPASQFVSPGLLVNTVSSTGQDTAETGDDNANENGDDVTIDGVSSGLVPLLVGTEPVGEPGKDGGANAVNAANDANTNLTVDFAFAAPGNICGSNSFVTFVGNLLGEALYTPINAVTLALFTDPDGDGVPNAPVDDPNTAGIQNYVITTTDSTYCFTNLPPGNYVVVQTQPPGYSSYSDDDETPDAAGSPPDSPNGFEVDNRIPVSLGSGETDIGNNFVEQITDPGKPQTTAAWQAQNPLSGQNDMPLNPDGDRYSNTLEYVFCMNPGEVSPPPVCIERTGTSSADLVIRRSATIDDLLYFSVESTTDLTQALIPWVPTTIVPIITNNGDGTITLRYPNVVTAATPNGTGEFFRVVTGISTDIDTYCPEIVGYIRHDAVPGCETIACPLLPKAEFGGTIGSVTGQTISLTGLTAQSLSPLLTPGAPYFIEITSGENNGNRFDVTGVGVNTLTLALDSDLCGAAAPYNTLAGAAPASLLGDTFVVYRHRTVNETFPSTDYQSGNSPATADRVLMKRGGGWDIYWLYTNGAGPAYWDLDGDAQFSDEGADVIPPSQGMFIHKLGSDTEQLICLGEIRQWNYCAPLCEADGCTFVAPGFPVDQSPADLQMLLSDGWDGDADPTLADKFIIWAGDAGVDQGYLCYWLTDAGPNYKHWTLDGDSTVPNKNVEKTFKRTRSSFIQPKLPRPTWCHPPPYINIKGLAS